MQKQKQPSLYQQQKAIKPLIEDMIPDFLDGDMKERALDFAQYLRANKMKPVWTLTNQWKAVYRGKCICYIALVPAETGYITQDSAGNRVAENVRWLITPYLEHIKEYEDAIISEGLQHYILDHAIYCAHAFKYPRKKDAPAVKNYGLIYPCNIWNCAPGMDVEVCGVQIKNKCRNGNRRHYFFKDPDAAEIDAIKRLLEMEQEARVESARKKMKRSMRHE